MGLSDYALIAMSGMRVLVTGSTGCIGNHAVRILLDEGAKVFVFNRCEPSTATFVAMETGHPWESQELSGLFSNPLLPPTAG